MISTGQKYEAVYVRDGKEVLVPVAGFALADPKHEHEVALVADLSGAGLIPAHKADFGKFFRIQPAMTRDERFFVEVEPTLRLLVEQGKRVLLKDRPEDYASPAALAGASTGVEELTAQMCHEVNRAYCQATGDDSQPAWEDAPDWQRESALAGVKKVFENPDITPAQLHDEWCAHKFADGWVHGAEKSPIKKTHPCLVPYGELPAVQRVKDQLFRAVCTTAIGLTSSPDAE